MTTNLDLDPIKDRQKRILQDMSFRDENGTTTVDWAINAVDYVNILIRDLPALIREVETLRTVREELTFSSETFRSLCIFLVEHRDRLYFSNVRLKHFFLEFYCKHQEDKYKTLCRKRRESFK